MKSSSLKEDEFTYLTFFLNSKQIIGVDMASPKREKWQKLWRHLITKKLFKIFGKCLGNFEIISKNVK